MGLPFAVEVDACVRSNTHGCVKGPDERRPNRAGNQVGKLNEVASVRVDGLNVLAGDRLTDLSVFCLQDYRRSGDVDLLRHCAHGQGDIHAHVAANVQNEIRARCGREP